MAGWRLGAGAAAAVVWMLSASAGFAAAKPDARLLAAVQACGPQARVLLERVVAVDSGTGDAEGLAKVGALFSEALQGLGAEVRAVPSPAPAAGDNLVATLKGTGRGRILLIAHMDTVFSRGAVAARGPHWEGDHYIGPGAGDDKGGAVTGVCALKAIAATGFRDFARIDYLLNASEETGSQGSRDLIRARAKDADAVINLERGAPTDKVTVARKGAASLRFEVVGRAAHSGLEPEKGRNAALEAARVALALGALSDPAKQTTVNVTVLNGGEKTNVIPDKAVVNADVRAFSPAEFTRIEAAGRAIASAPGIDGVTMTSSLTVLFPPWAPSAATDGLLARANRLYAELGRSLSGAQSGSSADVAYAAETGTPSIDGFGMEGGGAHGLDDYADFATLTPRGYLLARMLMNLGRDPPKR